MAGSICNSSYADGVAVEEGSASQAVDGVDELTGEFDGKISGSLKYISTVATVVIIIFGCLVLACWTGGGGDLVKIMLNSQFTLKANGAFCLILSALSLLLLRREGADRRSRGAAYVGAVGVLLIGLATLGEHLFGWELGIDQVLAKETAESAGASVLGRMPPVVALSFALASLSLLTRNITWSQLWRVGQIAIALVAVSSLGSIVGYCYGVPPLDNVMSFTRTPFPMALSLGLLSVGRLLAWPELWPMSIFVSRNAGGITMRRLFPAVVAVPVAIGGIRLAGEQARCYGHEFGSTLLVVLMVLVLMLLLYWSARSLDRHDTARKLAQALLNNEKRTHFILEKAPVGFIAANEDGSITDWNPHAERMFGLTRSEAIGRGLTKVMTLPETEAGFGSSLACLFDTNEDASFHKPREFTGLHRSGQGFPVEAAVFPIRLAEGWSFYAFVQDVTDRKQREVSLLTLSRELARSNAELQQFAKVASHDLQEPLRVIKGYVQLLDRRYNGKLDRKADEFMHQIVDGTDRMGQLIEGVLAHSRIRGLSGPLGVTDCTAVIEEAIRNLEVSIRESGAQITYSGLPAVVADRLELLQLFQNLISNAIKYRASVPPDIQISAEDRESCWVFAVKDNGIGIDARYYDQIFGMFKRLHGRADYAGTGIGLAICKKIVESHGGEIWVESEPGQGSTFFFTLRKSSVLAMPVQAALASS